MNCLPLGQSVALEAKSQLPKFQINAGITQNEIHKALDGLRRASNGQMTNVSGRGLMNLMAILLQNCTQLLTVPAPSGAASPSRAPWPSCAPPPCALAPCAPTRGAPSRAPSGAASRAPSPSHGTGSASASGTESGTSGAGLETLTATWKGLGKHDLRYGVYGAPMRLSQ